MMASFLVLSWATAALANNSLGKVVDVFGEAKVLPGNVFVAKGMGIKDGQRIRTGERSWVKVQFGTEAAIQISPSTEVRVGKNAKQVPSMHVIYGGLLSHLRPKWKQETKLVGFEVKTKNVVMGVGGTTFFVKEPKDGNGTYLCVCEGTVRADWEGARTEITSKHHDHPMILRASAKAGDPAEMLDHDNSDVDALKALLPPDLSRPPALPPLPAPKVPNS